MGISTYNYPQQSTNIKKFSYLDGIRNNVRKNHCAVGGLQQDTFVRSGENVCPETFELEKLFPNGEIYNICEDIIRNYGLETPPEIRFVSEKDNNDYASAKYITNKVDINLNKLLSPNMYKFKIKKGEKESYLFDDDTKRISIIDTTDKDLLNEVISYNKNKNNADSCTVEPLSDNDKRKLVIQTIAHELRHCYQRQIIRHTEGLDEFKMIEEQLRKNPNKPKMNLIEEKLAYINLKNEYMKHYKEKDFEKIYTQSSLEGTKACEWYDAIVNYVNYESDYEGYKKNAIELDANNIGNQYLINNYGNFEGIDK